MSELDNIDWMLVADQMNKETSDGVLPRFYIEAVPDKRRTEEDGIARFKEVVMVELLYPGDKTTRHKAVVEDSHKRRWPLHWARFQESKKAVESGTPLEMWPQLNRVQVAELKAMNIHTVEQLWACANNDMALQRIGIGARKLVEQAGLFLKPADEKVAALRKSAREAENTIEQLRIEVANLRRQLESKETAHADA